MNPMFKASIKLVTTQATQSVVLLVQQYAEFPIGHVEQGNTTCYLWKLGHGLLRNTFKLILVVFMC